MSAPEKKPLDLSQHLGPRGGTYRSPAWIMVCRPPKGDECLVAFKGDEFAEQVDAIGSGYAGDYGLDNVPGNGLWVLECEFVIKSYKCNHPLDPPEWDVDFEYKGEFRRPTLEELRQFTAEGDEKAART
jgi:hypothetical protein